jgi:hypothetical protein
MKLLLAIALAATGRLGAKCQATLHLCAIVYLLRVDEVREDGAKRPDNTHAERNRAQNGSYPVGVGCCRRKDP